MEQIPFQPSYARPLQGVRVIVVEDLPLPETFRPTVSPHLVIMEPEGWGGNHRHRRQEAFVALSKGLYMIWKDDAGERHEAPMMPEGDGLLLFMVPSMLSHMIENRSDESAILYELMDINDGPAAMLEGEESLR